ncbi:MAG: hypothetical protein OXG72_12260 [Acidobacteria bacterium]|nr:hypothetical protein [Acidobacteriota bacterium]
MDIASLVQWAIGIVIVVLSAAWGRTANRISRNNDTTARLSAEIAELRGRQSAHEAQMQVLLEEVRNTHQRIGGVAQSTNRIEGQVTAMSNMLTPILEHLLQADKGGA